MRYNFLSSCALIVCISAFNIGCKKKEIEPVVLPENAYPVPTTYNFENVDYSGQTARIAMMDALGAEMRKGNTGLEVSAQKLKDMFANTNAPFADAELNTSGKDLKSKTYELDRQLFEGYMDSLAIASKSGVSAKEGVAGVIESNDGTKKYLVSANGIEYAQVIQKGLMGATFYYQIADGYLSDAKMGNHVNNTEVTPGKGTTMEHHWDEAFGYFGVPVDFPANLEGRKYWGSYSNSRNPVLGSNKILMDAFLKGRAAISNKDMATKDAQRAIIKQELERIAAASAIHYLSDLKTPTDQAIVSHHGSEAIGFVMALKYNPEKKITQTQIDQVLDLIGDNLYEINIDNIQSAIDILSSVYGFDSIKNTL